MGLTEHGEKQLTKLLIGIIVVGIILMLYGLSTGKFHLKPEPKATEAIIHSTKTL